MLSSVYPASGRAAVNVKHDIKIKTFIFCSLVFKLQIETEFCGKALFDLYRLLKPCIFLYFKYSSSRWKFRKNWILVFSMNERMNEYWSAVLRFDIFPKMLRIYQDYSKNANLERHEASSVGRPYRCCTWPYKTSPHCWPFKTIQSFPDADLSYKPSRVQIGQQQ